MWIILARLPEESCHKISGDHHDQNLLPSLHNTLFFASVQETATITAITAIIVLKVSLNYELVFTVLKDNGNEEMINIDSAKGVIFALNMTCYE